MADEQHPKWRHLCPISGLDDRPSEAFHPLHVVVEIDETSAGHPVIQHLAWMLVTLIVRSTAEVVERLRLNWCDKRLMP
jgi:hypothetical protein